MHACRDAAQDFCAQGGEREALDGALTGEQAGIMLRWYLDLDAHGVWRNEMQAGVLLHGWERPRGHDRRPWSLFKESVVALFGMPAINKPSCIERRGVQADAASGYDLAWQYYGLDRLSSVRLPELESWHSDLLHCFQCQGGH